MTSTFPLRDVLKGFVIDLFDDDSDSHVNLSHDK